MKILEFIKPAPLAEEITDKEKIKRDYKYWRIRIFYSMYIGYAFFYFTRKSYTFAMSEMKLQLGFTNTQLGLLGSILYISYGLSKFLSGILSDKSNPRYFMAFGLILTGVSNILFGFSTSLILFAVLWGLNGWFQGWGWPPCARLLTHWYSQKERGTWWGIWNSCHNVGGATIPIVVSSSIAFFGSWSFGLWIPGVLCILVGIFLVDRLRDTPQSLGLPPIEKHKNEVDPSLKKEDYIEKELSVKEILVKYVLKNKFIWLLAIAYFFIYVVRTAIYDWGIVYLREERGTTFAQASFCAAAFEIGGILGSLAAGWMSDKIFTGRRAPANIIFTVGTLLATGVMWFMTNQHYLLYGAVMFMIGFFVFGPQMLIGMAAAELSHKKAAGTATGFVGWAAYIGAAFTGALGKVTDSYGWYGFFYALVTCGVVAALLLIPLWGSRTYHEQNEETPAA